MPNLEIVSLSVNKINTLKCFAYCPKLKEIYLRKNNIGSLSELRYLADLSNLSVLWLLDNPCAEDPSYRARVISALPYLTKLDNQAVTSQERASAAQQKPAQLARPDPKPEARPEPKPEPRSRPYRPDDRRLEDRAPRGDDWRAEEKPARAEERRVEEKPVRRAEPVLRELKQPEGGNRAPSPREPLRDAKSSKENIVCAVLALLKELDESSLELIKRDIERKLNVR